MPKDINDNAEWGGTPQTGGDITPNFQNLDLAITALRDAICAAGAGARTIADIITALTNGTQVNDITRWGGTVLTGRDITGDIDNLQNLDLAITALRDAILGVGNNTLTDIVNALTGGAATGATVTIANNINISGGVVGTVGNYNRWSLFIYAAAAINITIELSPNAGANYYDITESPIAFAAAGDKVYEMGYTADRIRLTGSNATLCTVQIRGTF
jgi:hypothetical protein